MQPPLGSTETDASAFADVDAHYISPSESGRTEGGELPPILASLSAVRSVAPVDSLAKLTFR